MKLFEVFGEIDVKGADEFSKQIDKADKKGFKFNEGLKKIGTAATAAGLAVGAAFAGMVVSGVKGADELSKATNKLATQTGATDEEMKSLNESIKNIYANNFGDSFEDVANAIASVKINTGLAGEELEKATEKAILLKDSFDFDVDETTRAVSVMMKQFGIDADKAYNIIALGAQKGANKNGDLLDVITEYSNQYADLGMNAGVFMESLVEGADAGIFSMDKIGDAIKEFNIRSKDLSDTSFGAYLTLGYTEEQAKSLFAEFAEGGETAQMAMQDVVYRLSQIEDPLKRNSAGVGLFGTQFEDVGDGIIDVLANLDGKLEGTDGYIQDTTGLMEKMGEIRYDSLGEAFEGIKRQISTTFISVSEELLPVFTNFSQLIQDKMPQIQSFITNAFEVTGELVTTSVNIFKNNLLPILKTFYDSINRNMPVVKRVFESVFSFVENYILPVFKDLFNVAKDIFPKIKSVAVDSFSSIEGTAETLYNFFNKYILPVIKKVYEVAKDNIPKLAPLFSFAFDSIGATIEITAAIIDGVISSIEFMIETVKDGLDWLGKFASKSNNSQVPTVGGSMSFGGYRAEGGPVESGTSYVVGEKGPEIFVPNQSGTIIPNGGGMNITINGLSVREEADVNKIARQLYLMTQRNSRGLGVV